MAVKVEKGGWCLIFLVGLALVGYSLYRYGALGFVKQWTGGEAASSSRSSSQGSAADRTGSSQPPAGVDTSKPLAEPASSTGGKGSQVRIRVNIWVGCAGGLVANGGLETEPGSI